MQRLRLNLSLLLLAAGLTASFLSSPLQAQNTGTLKGQVTDSTGSAIPGANVVVTGKGSAPKTLSTDETGSFSSGLNPGSYTIQITKFGFATYSSKPIAVAAGKTQTLTIPLELQASKQEVTVSSDAVGTVNVDPVQNAGQLVLKGTDLEALPDDPDDLAADLQALAGPAAGPNGGQIYIDGFTGGSLPPKSSIREIRINQNPYSAEFDRVGFGRIEILTKPGSDRLRGSVSFNDSESVFNSRNPFLIQTATPSAALNAGSPGTVGTSNLTPTFSSRQYEGNVGGPLGKKASYFIDFQRRNIEDNAIINASLLDTVKLTPYQFSTAYATPNHRTEISPRVDYQINSNNTIVMRYQFEQQKQTAAGIGQFTLASQAYNTESTEQNIRITETAVLSAKVINETRFQWLKSLNIQTGNNSLPSINVLQAFNGGGSQVGRSYDLQHNFELSNFTSFSAGTHSLKAGFRVRSNTIDDYSPQNFGGTFQFAGGGTGPQLDVNNQPIPNTSVPVSSIERYRRTLLANQLGINPLTLGGGASQFSIAAGNPYAGVNQEDVGIFLTDDWRFRPNLTISMGLRYEFQTNISDHRAVAPRVGIAWSPGKSGRSKTVLRFGAGMFYDRFSANNTLSSERFNGTNEASYVVSNPAFFPLIPALGTISTVGTQNTNTIRLIDGNLTSPTLYQGSASVERQLPHNMTLAVTYIVSHDSHMLRSRNINAPLPGTVTLNTNGTPIPGTGVFPYGASAGSLYQYESDGTFNQNQLNANVNARITPAFTLSGYYVLAHAKSNSDGAGTFPSNQYDLSTEYGRASFDVRHRGVIFGNYTAKYTIRLSPFVIMQTGNPFNITDGQDVNGDLQYTDRPTFASASACGSSQYIYCTKFGNFNTRPVAGQAIIPRNYGQGPGTFTVNLRISKTFGFGESIRGRGAANAAGGGRDGGGGPPGGGMMGMGGGGGGPRGGGGGGGGMRGGGGGGGGGTDHRYNLTVSANARNLLNHTNPANYSGNLTSPYFGIANALGGGGFGPPGGATNNRRLDFQLRFSF